MYSSRLKIDTQSGSGVGLPSGRVSARETRSPLLGPRAGPRTAAQRLRSVSNASTSSSLSIVSPDTHSTNASTSSLQIPTASNGPGKTSRSRSQSPSSPRLDELGPEYVLAMHDYFPQHQSATCLSFRAGQVIHVLNRDNSGWWDGELEGRRGWFPSNYVNTEANSLTEEELPPPSSHFVCLYIYLFSTAPLNVL